MNDLGAVDTFTIENEYIEDLFESKHTIGSDGNYHFYGFIGDFSYYNYFLDNFTSISQISGPFCRSCVACPATESYLECVGTAIIPSRINSDCSAHAEPFCPIDCDLGFFDNGYIGVTNCAPCASGCDSCNDGLNCRPCDDPLCATCTNKYSVCTE